MRIAVDITVLEQPISGIARVILGLYEACSQLDPLLEITGIHQNPLECALPSYFRNVRWGGWLPGRMWRRLGPSCYVCCRKPDVIHFPWNSGFVRPHGKCLTVLTIHDVIPLALPDMHFRTVKHRNAYCKLMQDSLNNANIVLTDSEASKHDILHYLRPHSEPVVIYPGLFLKSVLREIKSSKATSGGYFIYQGGYHPRKGLQHLVPVYRELYRQKQVTQPLVLVGKPNHSIIPDLGMEIDAGIREGAIVEKGYVTDGELLRLMRAAIALIYPSLYEGFGLPLLEAMSVGCPVIACNVSSMPEVCRDAAVYVTPGNGAELAEAIKRMGNDNDLRVTLRDRGFAQASKFSWEQSARQYLELLRPKNR